MSKPRFKHIPWCSGLVALCVSAACVLPPQDSAVLDPPTALLHHPEDRGYDALSYGLDFQIDSERPILEGTTRIRLRTTKALSELVFDAADMEILAVSSETSGVELLPYVAKRRTLTIPLASTLAADTTLSLDIQYRTSPLAGMHFSLPQLDGLDHVPHVYTQGEAQRARFWFPCNDNPADRATHTLRAQVPRSWVTVAAGHQLGHDLDPSGTSVVDTWALDQEMPTYLFTFAAGPFLKLEDHWEDVPLWFVGEPQDVDRLNASFQETAEVLDFISDYTGFRYPFAKYAQVAVRDFPFGGMENVSATTVTRNALHVAEYQQARPSWGLVAHEAAHQWFGDVVSCVDWTHAWLNEGFATYMNLLYRGHREGEAAFLAAMGDTLDTYLSACRGEGLRALVKKKYRLPMDLFFDGTIYPGGATRLNLFRGILGESQFREALQIYLHRNAFRSVDSDDFRMALEDASGRDLTQVFAQWVYAPGYPELKIEWSHHGRELQVHVMQVQPRPTLVPPAFHFPLDLRWYEQGQWRETRLQITQENEVFQITTGSHFDGWLEIDPYVYVPAKFVVEESHAATLLCAQKAWSSRCRLLALRRLDSSHAEKSAETWWQVARGDEVPRVRLEAIALLRKKYGQSAAIAQLRASFRAEKNAQVRAAWWQWIADYVGDPNIRVLLEENLQSSASLTGLRVSAFHALAKSMDETARFNFAHAWLSKDSGEGEGLRLAAMQVLAALAHDKLQTAQAREIRSILLPLSWKGNSTPIRVAALQHLSLWLEDLVAESPSAVDLALLDTFHKALRSFSAPLRRAAAAGVANRKELFKEDIQMLLDRDPDARIRRLLEH